VKRKAWTAAQPEHIVGIPLAQSISVINTKRVNFMRQTKGVAVLMIASAAFLAAQTDPPGRVGRLNYTDGPVSFQPAAVNDWVDASVNRPLISGDNIWVGDRGRSELHVGSTAVRLGPNTAFQFLNLDDQTVQIRLSEGTLTIRMRSLAQNQIFEVDTPNMAFTLVRPGEYRIDANPDSRSTVITVRDGEGDVTGGGDTFPVYARQQVVVRGDDQITYNLASAPRDDAWDQWCSSRDQREDRSLSARYVSREMDGYEDLDQYGRWDNQSGYGNVWMPTSVDAGWAPYRDGHWAWIAPWGWTWVDDAPWGFAPYHYGRWASFGGRWGWIPGPYGVTPVYAPALVAWIGGGGGGSGFSLSFSFGTAAAVGWFPLGPREPYFPSYQASRGYFTRVNNTNTVINTTVINNYYDSGRSNNAITGIRYANRSVQNGVTAVPQQTFARGSRVTQDARAVPSAQLSSAQVFGAPAIAPQRESVLGVRADTASRAPRPPANVLSRPVVARTAPAPAPVPFDRQQPGLAKTPGRPLPAATVQQLRQAAPAPAAPVRVVDMGRIKRVQPTVGAGPQGAPQQNTVPPSAVERQKGRQQPPQVSRPPVERPQPAQTGQQKGRQQAPQAQQPPQQPQREATPPPAQTPQAPVIERQKGRQQPPPRAEQPPQQPQRQVTPLPAQTPQAPVVERQKGRQQAPQAQQPPQQPQRQVTPPPAQTPQAPVVERQNGRQQQPPPQQAAPAQAQPPQTPAAERPQRQDKGKQGKSRNDKDKQDQ
jgi:hypothetical protein